MPSPFPGMDPYLEAPDMWRGTQKGLLVMLCAAINRQLPEPFCTLVTERLIPHEDFIEPLSELCIEIKNRFAPGRPTISVIEVFTHIHKSAGRGREEYLAKQKILLESDVHLLEIDFLRSGEHTLATSKTEIEEHCGLFHYAASLHRGGYGRRFQAVGWTVQDRLPTVLVPLDEAHPDIETLVVNYVFAAPSPFEGLKSLATNAFGASSGRENRKQNGRMRQANAFSCPPALLSEGSLLLSEGHRRSRPAARDFNPSCQTTPIHNKR